MTPAADVAAYEGRLGWTSQLTFGEGRDEGVSACPAVARVRLRQHGVNLGLAFGNQVIQRQPSRTVSLRRLTPSRSL
jgi:hypothetical protein